MNSHSKRPHHKTRQMTYLSVYLPAHHIAALPINNSIGFHYYSQLKPHRCQQIDCERSFATPSELRGHSYRHSGSWPHTCTICRTGFSKASALGKHLQTHALTSDASTPTKGKLLILHFYIASIFLLILK